jgi:hypothetical protein
VAGASRTENKSRCSEIPSAIPKSRSQAALLVARIRSDAAAIETPAHCCDEL